MSYELIITRSKKIESLLESMGASGRGLHEKATSIEADLPRPLVKRIRFIATVRNKLVHDIDTKPTASIISDFKSACDEAEKELSTLINDTNTSLPKVIVAIGAAFVFVYSIFRK